MLFLSIFLVSLAVTVKGAPRIAGGAVADISEYPFSAALMTNRGGGGYVHACGGSIVSATAILSAASCFYDDQTLTNPAQWQARVGSASSVAGGFIHFINRITVHHEFNLATYVNDLAVVRPTVALFFRQNVQPAPIAGMAYPIVDRQEIWAIGWGATSSLSGNSAQLREVRLFVADQQICASRYNNIGFVVTENMVCAGWLDVGVTAQCEGDNGSPLVVDGVVVGVKSRSEQCPDPDFPAINTRVGPYARWIVSVATAE